MNKQKLESKLILEGFDIETMRVLTSNMIRAAICSKIEELMSQEISKYLDMYFQIHDKKILKIIKETFREKMKVT